MNSSWVQISLNSEWVTQASCLVASLTHLLLGIFPLYRAYTPSRAHWGGPQPQAPASTHQRLLMEDVNICSGASHGSPSLCRDCSKHINISEAKGTSGHAVPLSVRTGKYDVGWYTVLPSIACVWTRSSCSFLSSRRPFEPVLPLAQDSWWQQEPSLNEAPPASCLLYPMTLEMPLNFHQSLQWHQLFTKQCHQEEHSQIRQNFLQCFVYHVRCHFSSAPVESPRTKPLTLNRSPVSRHCSHFHR